MSESIKSAKAANAIPQGTEVGSETDTGPPPSTVPDNFLSFLSPPQREGELGRLDRYRILQELGRGGMGCVLLGEHVELQRKVAIKIMLPSFARDAVFRERFLREARAVAKLKHDHIVTIFDVAEHNGVPFIVMEFLEGSSLDDCLEKKNGLSLDQILKVGRQIAEGLQAAHEKGLIHRDIKPANIWLEAQDGRVKILDFGLVREQTDDLKITLTGAGAVLGTPLYMSPEQAMGEKVDRRTDLFSLGVVLYWLCTGKQPFMRPTQGAVLIAIATEMPTPVRERNPAIPAKLEGLINRLLAKKRDERFASAEEVARELRAIEARADSRERPVKAEATRRQDTVRLRNPTRRLLLAAATLALFVSVIFMVRGVWSDKPRPDTSVAENRDPVIATNDKTDASINLAQPSKQIKPKIDDKKEEPKKVETKEVAKIDPKKEDPRPVSKNDPKINVKIDPKLDGKTILDNAIEAHGGEAELRKLHSSSYKIKGMFHVMGEDIPFIGNITTRGFDHQRIDLEQKVGDQTLRILYIVKKDKGWVKLNDYVSEMDKEELTEWLETAHNAWVTTLVPLKDKDYTLNIVGEEKVNDQPVVVMLVSRKDHRDIKLSFDKKTDLLVKVEMLVKDRGRGVGVPEELFMEDYNDKGLRQPRKITFKHEGKPFMDQEISGLRVEQKFDDTLFDKP